MNAHAEGAARDSDGSLIDVIAEYEEAGFVGQFVPDPNGHLRCLTCQQRSHADEVTLHFLRRLEGTSDPADMAAVAAIECPRCAARGTVVLKYGPDTTIEEAQVLRLLERERRPAS